MDILSAISIFPCKINYQEKKIQGKDFNNNDITIEFIGEHPIFNQFQTIPSEYDLDISLDNSNANQQSCLLFRKYTQQSENTFQSTQLIVLKRQRYECDILQGMARLSIINTNKATQLDDLYSDNFSFQYYFEEKFTTLNTINFINDLFPEKYTTYRKGVMIRKKDSSDCAEIVQELSPSFLYDNQDFFDRIITEIKSKSTEDSLSLYEICPFIVMPITDTLKLELIESGIVKECINDFQGGYLKAIPKFIKYKSFIIKSIQGPRGTRVVSSFHELHTSAYSIGKQPEFGYESKYLASLNLTFKDLAPKELESENNYIRENTKLDLSKLTVLPITENNKAPIKAIKVENETLHHDDDNKKNIHAPQPNDTINNKNKDHLAIRDYIVKQSKALQ